MNNLKNKKIFIIEPSKIISKKISKTLEKAGASIKSNTCSDTAIMEIIYWKPDIIITSVQVGEIKGFDLCFILKLMPGYSSIPVIIISSGKKDLMLKKSADVGADYYIAKDDNVILNIINTLNKMSAPDVKLTPKKQDKKIKKGKLLLVDDSSVMRHIIINMLKTMNIKDICEACDGQEAIKQMKKNDIGLVFTDWNMPVMDGLEFIKTVRKRPEFDTVPIIMVTTESASKELEISKKAGANGHLSKPFNAAKLKEAVENFLDHIIINDTKNN